jgi:hypothetical protein
MPAGTNQRGSGTVIDLTVPKTILAQLGGEHFVMMSGATGFIGSADPQPGNSESIGVICSASR